MLAMQLIPSTTHSTEKQDFAKGQGKKAAKYTK